MVKSNVEIQNHIDRLRNSGARLVESPPGEIRIDLRSQRLAEMMGYSLVRSLSPGGGLSNFFVVQLPSDPNVRPKPIDGITNYGVSPIRMRR